MRVYECVYIYIMSNLMLAPLRKSDFTNLRRDIGLKTTIVDFILAKVPIGRLQIRSFMFILTSQVK